MAPYSQYNNFYDPVGSHATQPQEYTYQTSTATTAPYLNSAAPAFPTAYQNHNSAYGNQQYSAETHQFRPASNANHAAAAALSDLGGHGYAQSTTLPNQAGMSNDLGRLNQNPNSYGQLAGRSHNTKSPLYAAKSPVAAFERREAHGSSSSNPNSYGHSQAMYQADSSNGNHQTFHSAQSSTTSNTPAFSASNASQFNQPPPRYSSPIHAIQAQQSQHSQRGHDHQPTRHSTQQPSPQLAVPDPQHTNATQRQQNPSVEGSATTVDPSQVYDIRAEQQRKARVEALRWKRVEAEEAQRKANEAARIAEQERQELERRKLEEERAATIVENTRKAEEEKQVQKAAEDAVKKKQAQERKNEQRRKARQEKQQSKSAATALQQIAFGSGNGKTSTAGPESDASLNDEESEMRALFKRMREFNQRNPSMLAKLWEEERQTHSGPSPSHASKATPAPASQSQLQASKSSPAPSTQSLSQPAMQPLVASGAGSSATKKPTISQESQDRPSSSVQASISLTSSPAPAIQARSANTPQQQASTTLWPPHKKGILADAAAKWLSDLPANRSAGRVMSKADILKVLETNPSYVQLCESIERLGIKFERSALARELLKAVPDGLKAQNVPKAMMPPTPPNATGAQSSDISTSAVTNDGQKGGMAGGKVGAEATGSSPMISSFTPLAHAARDANSLNVASPAPPNAGHATAMGGPQAGYQNHYYSNHNLGSGRTQFSSQPLDSGSDVKIESRAPPRVPADKEEAARKRTFGDLVDLSKSDSDDEMPPRKMIQVAPSTHAVAMANQPPQSTFRHSMSVPQPPYLHSAPPGFASGLALIHPPIPAILSTPSHPAVNPPVTRKGPTAEQVQSERIRGKMLVEPLMRDRVARKSKYDVRTIARDVLLATGRHPDMRALNAHLNPMDKLLSTHGGQTDGIGNKSDLSTIRWDIIDPEDATADGSGSKFGREDEMADADDEDDEPAHRRALEEQTTRAHGSGGKANIEGKSAERHARRGRPPKSATRLSDRDPASHRPGFIEHSKLDRSPAAALSGNESAVSRTMSPSTPAVGYAAFRQVDENGNVIKKKGRPVGWRKSIHSREAHGLTPAPKPASAARPRPGAPRKTAPEMESPHYEVYRCRWRGCKSELHNLGALNKHIVKIHGEFNNDGMYECAWRGCRGAHPELSGSGPARDNERDGACFDTIEEWAHHIDKQHLQDIAWKLGDGPRGGSLSDPTALRYDSDTSYLSDAQGRSVTPVISPEPAGANPNMPGPDSLVWASGRRPGGHMSRDERDAAAELKRLEDAKRVEGPFMGTEGTRLANAKRRLGFLDDEDFADEMESSELGEE